jgi:nitrogen fixation NifU-like protein
MYSAAILDHFERPRNSGELAAPAVTVEETNPVCGDILRIFVLLENGRVSRMTFKAKGCVAAIAVGSVLTELAGGRTREEALRITPAEIAEAVGGLPPESGHAAELAIHALRSALAKA